MFCFKCGKELSDKMAYCPFCGEKVYSPEGNPAMETADLTKEHANDVNEGSSQDFNVSFRLFIEQSK